MLDGLLSEPRRTFVELLEFDGEDLHGRRPRYGRTSTPARDAVRCTLARSVSTASASSSWPRIAASFSQQVGLLAGNADAPVGPASGAADRGPEGRCVSTRRPFLTAISNLWFSGKTSFRPNSLI
jgi:hypothetical protein